MLVNRNLQVVVVAILLLVFPLACRKHQDCYDLHNPECPNYAGPLDPCAGIPSVSAHFAVCQKTGGDDSCRQAANDVLCELMIVLTAEQSNASMIKWILGRDTLEGRTVEFYFADSLAGGSYPVTLIVKAPIDSVCNPNDNGLDTVTKFIRPHSICSAGWEGHWRGNMSGYNQPVDITLYIDQQSGDFFNPCNRMKNTGVSYFTDVECSCDNPTTNYDGCWNYFYTYNYNLETQNIPCFNDIMTGWVSSDNNHILLHIGQVTDSIHYTFTPRIFTGERVN
jgi:hypothetical protein